LDGSRSKIAVNSVMAQTNAERQRQFRKRRKAQRQLSERVIDAAFVAELNRMYVKGGDDGFWRAISPYAKKLDRLGRGQGELSKLYAPYSTSHAVMPLADQSAWLDLARDAGANRGKALAEKLWQEFLAKMRSADRLDQIPQEDGGTMENIGVPNHYTYNRRVSVLVRKRPKAAL